MAIHVAENRDIEPLLGKIRKSEDENLMPTTDVEVIQPVSGQSQR